MIRRLSRRLHQVTEQRTWYTDRTIARIKKILVLAVSVFTIIA